MHARALCLYTLLQTLLDTTSLPMSIHDSMPSKHAPSSASIIAPATLYPLSLAHRSSRWTERHRRYLHCLQDRSKHRTRLLPEKPLCRCSSVRRCKQKVVHCGEACTLPGVVESTQCMVAQREVAVAPFHIGTGALEHLREPCSLLLEPVLRDRVQGP